MNLAAFPGERAFKMTIDIRSQIIGAYKADKTID